MKKWLIISLLIFILAACGQQDSWEASPTFTSEGVAMQGVKDHLAFATDEITPVKAGSTYKYLWHFWSDKTDYFGTFEIVATHEDNGKTVHVYGSQNTEEAQPLNGANHHLPALISLPDPGIWRIDVTFNTVLFDSVYIDVSQ